MTRSLTIEYQRRLREPAAEKNNSRFKRLYVFAFALSVAPAAYPCMGSCVYYTTGRQRANIAVQQTSNERRERAEQQQKRKGESSTREAERKYIREE